jgi:hypothetical protein
MEYGDRRRPALPSPGSGTKADLPPRPSRRPRRLWTPT